MAEPRGIVLAQISLAYLRIRPDRFWRAGGDHTAIDQHAESVCKREYRFHIVLDQHNGVLTLQLAQQRQHASRLVRAESRHRLVKQKEARRGSERHRNLDLPVLAMAEPRNLRFGAGEHAHPVEREPSHFPQLALAPRGFPEAKGMA